MSTLEELAQEVAKMNAAVADNRRETHDLSQKLADLTTRIQSAISAERVAEAVTMHHRSVEPAQQSRTMIHLTDLGSEQEFIDARAVAREGLAAHRQRQLPEDREALADAAENMVLNHIRDHGEPELAAAVEARRQHAVIVDDDMPRLAAQPKAPELTPEQVQRSEWLKRFYGASSLWMKYFGPGLLSGATGNIHPHAQNTFDASLDKITIERLGKWPEGFYRNASTSAPQFLLKSAKVIAVLDFGVIASGAGGGVTVFFGIDGQTQRVYAEDLTVQQMNLISREIESHIVSHLLPRPH